MIHSKGHLHFGFDLFVSCFLSPRLQTLRILDFFEGTLVLMDNFKNDPQAKKLWDGAPRAWPARIMANPTCHVSAVSQQKSTV